MGDVGVVAGLLAQRVGQVTDLDQRPEVAERWAIWRDEKARRRQDFSDDGLGAASVFHAMSELVPEHAVLCVDVGNNAYSFGRYFEVSGHQSVLMSGYLGSIGFAFPAAMGAWAAVGNSRPVVSISGDGGFGQYAMELTTAVKYQMNITHVVLNNSELAKISKEQRAGEWAVWQTGLHNPDFAAFARLCGAAGQRVTSTDQLADALSDALAYPGPALVDVVSDPLGV
jgi:thiamine pyrophosphate-dependent acetolactate synthase large subunit-like protein